MMCNLTQSVQYSEVGDPSCIKKGLVEASRLMSASRETKYRDKARGIY